MAQVAHEEYVEAWRERAIANRQSLDILAQQRLEAADRLTRLLAEHFGVRKVFLFGSLAKIEGLHEHSDIDLAVEGLPPDRYFEALAQLWHHLPEEVELDLVPMEFASPEMLGVIRCEGVLLYAEE